MKLTTSLKLITILAIAVMSITFYGRFTVHSSGQTTLTIDPTSNYASKGQTLTINVTVLDVTNLADWQVRVGFNPSVVNCTNVTVPPNNIFDGQYALLTPEINNTKGYVRAFCYFDAVGGVNGSGILCQINFQCLAPGVTALELVQLDCPLCGGTYLQQPDYTFISFTDVDGAVEVTDQGFQENWFNMQSQPILVFSNSSITGFYVNETWKEATFDATGNAGSTGLASMVVPKSIINATNTLDKMMVKVDGTPIAYTVSKNTTHNYMQFSYQQSTRHIDVLVTLLGDVTGDRRVRVDDVLLVATHFGTRNGGPNWNPVYDLTGDGKVLVDDVLLDALEFGKNWNP
jgi:hypothetical protein